LIGAFTPAGKLIRWFDHVNDLNAPWGLAMAPSEFGTFSHHLLVGQFGSGEILAFNLNQANLQESCCSPADSRSNRRLWGIGFGAGNANSGPLTTLFSPRAEWRITAVRGFDRARGPIRAITANKNPGCSNDAKLTMWLAQSSSMRFRPPIHRRMVNRLSPSTRLP
jgi:hypothetical protein